MSTLLISTDEAGYGPKLGPLVIAASAWQIPADSCSKSSLDPPDDETLVDLFAPLREAVSCGVDRVVVDDSKAIFKPSKGIDSLHAVVSAAAHWSGALDDRFLDWLSTIAQQDLASIQQSRWLTQLPDTPFLSRHETEPLRTQWARTGLQLCDIRSRIITAKAFNAHCCQGANKADLLSEATIGLVGQLIHSVGSDRSRIAVFCDRHGGRRYYAGVLQHTFPDSQLHVVAESKQQSRYRLIGDGRTIDIAFTVKGDSFTPVALSSMIAKYLRERMMESLNAYFAKLHRGPTPLKSTAGYPVDADRFLKDIGPIIEAECIIPSDLIRSR